VEQKQLIEMTRAPCLLYHLIFGGGDGTFQDCLDALPDAARCKNRPIGADSWSNRELLTAYASDFSSGKQEKTQPSWVKNNRVRVILR
jgi:hypothetical protein